MNPWGKKNAESQYELGAPSYSHLAKNSNLRIRSSTHDANGLREGYPSGGSYFKGTFPSKKLAAMLSRSIDITTVP